MRKKDEERGEVGREITRPIFVLLTDKWINGWMDGSTDCFTLIE